MVVLKSTLFVFCIVTVVKSNEISTSNSWLDVSPDQQWQYVDNSLEINSAASDSEIILDGVNFVNPSSQFQIELGFTVDFGSYTGKYAGFHFFNGLSRTVCQGYRFSFITWNGNSYYVRIQRLKGLRQWTYLSEKNLKANAFTPNVPLNLTVDVNNGTEFVVQINGAAVLSYTDDAQQSYDILDEGRNSGYIGLWASRGLTMIAHRLSVSGSKQNVTPIYTDGCAVPADWTTTTTTGYTTTSTATATTSTTSTAPTKASTFSPTTTSGAATPAPVLATLQPSNTETTEMATTTTTTLTALTSTTVATEFVNSITSTTSSTSTTEAESEEEESRQAVAQNNQGLQIGLSAFGGVVGVAVCFLIVWCLYLHHKTLEMEKLPKQLKAAPQQPNGVDGQTAIDMHFIPRTDNATIRQIREPAGAALKTRKSSNTFMTMDSTAAKYMEPGAVGPQSQSVASVVEGGADKYNRHLTHLTVFEDLPKIVAEDSEEDDDDDI
mmetsp:Transcript_1617/g.3127  ORF Transcript_1617/g.3127 Transcript_1617/m.3127 type:complete len:494 (-) Transcript_1617:56-1537(-)